MRWDSLTTAETSVMRNHCGPIRKPKPWVTISVGISEKNHQNGSGHAPLVILDIQGLGVVMGVTDVEPVRTP
tara:strand:- start:333 stop:548 length:216 start_codon:yes stop_codon:yes gene_type:complete